jgi:putative hydrolase of the HAD superfamily
VAIRGVLFDWGGTIVRDDSVHLPAPSIAVASFVRGRLGLELDDAQFERAFQAALPHYAPGRTRTSPELNRLLGEAFTWLGLPVSAGDVEACARIFFLESTRGLDVYDDARALLASLKYRGYRTGVVTNAIFSAELFRPKVNELGLAGQIDVFVSSADIGLAKPDPSPFLRAAADLGLEPQELIFVGDNADTDIAGARAAKMRAVLLERTDRARDRAGFLVIERLTALNELLGDGQAP